MSGTPGRPKLSQEQFEELQRNLEVLSPERWEDHARWVDSDPLMDPREKKILLRRNLLGNAQMAEKMGRGPDRVSKLHPRPHITDRRPSPQEAPPPDEATQLVGGMPLIRMFEGIWWRWLREAGYAVFDPAVGEYVLSTPRVGRARSGRSTIGRVYKLGTGRKQPAPKTQKKSRRKKPETEG